MVERFILIRFEATEVPETPLESRGRTGFAAVSLATEPICPETSTAKGSKSTPYRFSGANRELGGKKTPLGGL